MTVRALAKFVCGEPHHPYPLPLPPSGCNGGDQLPALLWIAGKTKGLCTEAEWP